MSKKKVSDNELIKAYNRLGNIWKVGEEVGLCGQSVHERLVKLGIPLKNRKFSNEEKKLLKEVYESGIKRGDGKLKQLAEDLNRTIPFLSRKARELGLTTYSRECTEELKSIYSEEQKEWLKNNEHPKGMSGKKHSKKTKEVLSKKSKELTDSYSEEEWNRIAKKTFETKQKNGTLPNNRHGTSWKAQWASVGGKKHFFRSQWELDYAKYLQYLKVNNKIEEWEYEAKAFWFDSIKRGVRSYLPDFRVIQKDGLIEYHEVKGWMDDRSKTKLRRFAKYYPEETLVLIRGPEIKEIREKYDFLYE